MKDGVAKFMMACARNLAQVLNQVLALPPDQTRHNFIAQPREKLAIARQIPAVEQRDGKLNIVWIQPFALRQTSRSRTELQPQVPQLLRKTPDGIFEFTLGIIPGVQKQQIDIGVGAKPPAPESAGCHKRKILRAVRIGRAGAPGGRSRWRTDYDFVPEPLNNRIDQGRAPGNRRA